MEQVALFSRSGVVLILAVSLSLVACEGPDDGFYLSGEGDVGKGEFTPAEVEAELAQLPVAAAIMEINKAEEALGLPPIASDESSDVLSGRTSDDQLYAEAWVAHVRNWRALMAEPEI